MHYCLCKEGNCNVYVLCYVGIYMYVFMSTCMYMLYFCVMRMHVYNYCIYAYA